MKAKREKTKREMLLDRLTEGVEPKVKSEAERIVEEQTSMDKKVSVDWQVVVHATVILYSHKDEGMTGAEAREGVRGMVQELLDAIKRQPGDHIHVDAPIIRDGRP